MMKSPWILGATVGLVAAGGVAFALTSPAAADTERAPAVVRATDEGESSRYRFAYATGASLPAARPELPISRSFRTPCDEPAAASHGGITWPAYAFTKKVKLQSKVAVKGGCG